MSRPAWVFVPLVSSTLAGCDLARPPQLAIPQEPEAKPTASARVAAATETVSGAMLALKKETAREGPRPKYHGRTAEQWGELLRDGNSDQAYHACLALRILGVEGRHQMLQGLESPNPENRRLALESLSVANLRAYGDQGRQMLVRLAGDKADLRIRERANAYLRRWNETAPSP